MGIREVLSAPRSPWQRAYVERVIGTIRRDGVDQEKLTGSVAGAQGDMPIQEGKIAGNQISFSTSFDAGGNTIKILCKGTMSGDQMMMTREREGSGQPREFTIKRSGT